VGLEQFTSGNTTSTSPDTTTEDKNEDKEIRYCWLCSDKVVRIDGLSQLGNIWYCKNSDCRNSLKYVVGTEAVSKNLASDLNTEKAQKMLSIDDLKPDEFVVEKDNSGEHTLLYLSD